MNKATCVQFSTNLQSFMKIQGINSSMKSYAVESLAMLDSLFHRVVNTVSTPIGVEGGWWCGATKWRGSYSKKII